MKKRPAAKRRELRPRVKDLFGDVPVTWPEVHAWLAAVPRIPPDSPRAAWYLQAYDVVGKIKAAKLAGRLDDCLRSVSVPGHWWQRFTWAYR